MALKRGEVPVFDAVAAAQLTAANGTAVALASTVVSVVGGSSGLACLQADPGNSGTIKLGDADGQYVSLAAGDWFPFLVPVTNLSLIYALGSAAGQKLNVLVFK